MPDVESEGDPFADIEHMATVTAEPSRQELEDHLRDLMRQEAALERCGVTCPIKDRMDSVCAVCPLRERVAGRERLCRLGVTQERTTMALATYDERVEPIPA